MSIDKTSEGGKKWTQRIKSHRIAWIKEPTELYKDKFNQKELNIIHISRKRTKIDIQCIRKGADTFNKK